MARVNEGKKRLKRVAIGLFLATLPLVVCWVIAELFMLTSMPAEDASGDENKVFIARSVRFTGWVMSGVAWFGMGMFILSNLYEYTVVQRHYRRLEKLKREGKIESN